MEISFLNIIVLFGAVQGLTLCLYLAFHKTDHKRALVYFILFLLSISFYNLEYVAIFSEFQIGSFHLGALPIPYKYIFGAAFYLYALASITPTDTSMKRVTWLVLLPAILYGSIRLYWLYLILSSKNPMIIREVYDTGFFTLNELAYLIFNLIMILLISRRLRTLQTQAAIVFGKKKYWIWLDSISKVFLVFTVVHLLIQLASVLLNEQHNRYFYYPTLINNSLFIYWIGFIGYTKPNLIFFKPFTKSKSSLPRDSQLGDSLRTAMEIDRIYKNPRLTSQQLATHLEISTNELTRYINDQFGSNFSQYVNQYRTGEAIRLMKSELAEKYTLEALAYEAGFSSKSSFFKIFKEQTSKTPSAFMKEMD